MRKRYGQTLVEVLVTLLFIAFSLLGLIRFQNYLSYTNSYAQQKADAISLAEKQIENLRDYQVLNNTSGYVSYQGMASGSSSVNGSSASYTITWTVTAFANPTYKTIDVVVGWTDRYGAAQSVRLITHVAGIEPANSSAIM